jgi:hypothetical protein
LLRYLIGMGRGGEPQRDDGSEQDLFHFTVKVSPLRMKL